MLPKPSSCQGCPLYGTGKGFSRPDGAGNKGVLIVAEALGKEEEQAGIPLVGSAGHFLFSKLAASGLDRDDFTLFNVVACRPPDNKLVGMPYEKLAIKHCAPNLDAVIEAARAQAEAQGQTFTILTLGRVAFMRVMDLDPKHPIMTHDYKCYPFWNQTYKAWVIAADHPAFLMRGQTHLIPVMQFAASRAVEIATHGHPVVPPVYLEDPEPMIFKQWVDEYLEVIEKDPTETFLSYDIETPMKKGKDEEEVAKEDDDDYTILRCSFAYRPGYAVSVPWTAQYLPELERIFGSEGSMIGWNSEGYDLPRVAAQLQVRGDQIDAMLAWHVLNSALPKGLGFVTPFYVPEASVWKHLSDVQPAFYNAKDADMALRIWLGVRKDLKESKLGEVFNRHVIEVNRVFSYMSEQGVLLDQQARKDGEEKVAALLRGIEEQIVEVVPLEAKALKIYKKTPKDTTGMVETVSTVRMTQCPNCGAKGIKADHYKPTGKKALAAGTPQNPCAGFKSNKIDEISTVWAIPLEFKVSNGALQRYQAVKKHQPIFDPKKKTITFDEKAIKRLRKKYNSDPLYPLIVDFRGYQKLLSTYIGETQESGQIRGGMPIGRDGRIHTRFTQNPSTLRSASQGPNLQNLPRPGGPDDPATIIRNLIMAKEGSILAARDFCGIEAVLVGYFAMAPGYIRLALRDVHSFYTAYAIHELDPKRISANDLPLLSWDDGKLFNRLAEIKKEFKHDRNSLYKHLVHGCVTGDHEVLTPTGWKRFDMLEDHDQVAQWNSGKIEFVIPSKIIRSPYMGAMVHLENQAISICMTPNHRIPIANSYGTVQEIEAGQNLPCWGRVPTTGILDGHLEYGEDLLKLLVAIQADASLYGNHCVFHLVKLRKKERLLTLLKNIGIIYTQTKCTCHTDGIRIGFNIKKIGLHEFFLENKTFNLEKLLTLTSACKEIFLKELPFWDGVRGGESGKQTAYLSTNTENIKTIQTLAHVSNKRSLLRNRGPGGFGTKNCWNASLANSRYASINERNKFSQPFTGIVYCVTVPSGWFLIKHQNKISVTGNSNFMQGPKGATEKIYSETNIEYDVSLVKKVMEIYFELFPEIRKWHSATLFQADKDGYVRNPFGYIHRFNKVYDWEKVGGVWQKEPGPDANKVIAFGPQSTAAGIIKEAMLRLFNQRFEEAGQYLRLLVHDELFFEIPLSLLEKVDRIVKEEMERPIVQLPLPKSYGMGDYLAILTEEKVGIRWGSMK